MQLRTPAALAVTSVLLLGGVAACSSSTSTSTESPTSVAPSAEATPNGVQKESADKILESAKAAAKEATSVKLAVVTDSDGTEVRTDLSISDAGSQGTLGQPDGASVEVVSTPDTIYVKGDAFAQSLGGEAAAQTQGKWVSIPTDNPAAQSFTGLNSIDSFVDNVLTTPKSLTKGDEKDLNGTPAIALKSDQGTLWVATTGEPYPLQIDAPEGTKGQLTLTEWNVPVSISVPPADQVVDITSIASAAPSPAPSAS